MGILDAILGTNTTQATDTASQNAMAMLGMTGQENAGILRRTTNKANDALQTGAAAATGDVTKGYNGAIDTLHHYGNEAQDALTAGVNSAVGTVQGSNAAYQPYIQNGGAANTLYGNALGLGGAAGHDAATSAFQTSPGYEFQVDQSVDGAARKAAALGVAGSGNTLDAITRLSSNLANTEYGGWLDRLSGLSQQGLSAANSVSSNNQAAGGYQYGGGGTLAQILGNMGTNIGSARIGKGTALGGIQTNLGNSLSGNFTNLGSNLASNNLSVANNMATIGLNQAKADDTASNTNSGILSNLIGRVSGLPLGSSPLASGSNGFTVSPGSNGAFSISPTGGSSSGGGILGALTGFKF